MRKVVGMGLATIMCVSCPCVGLSHTAAPTPAVHDGQHDFDFNLGVWHTHIKRILDPFASSSNSVELNGTVTVRKVWGGKAELEEAIGRVSRSSCTTRVHTNGVSRSRTARSGC